MLSHKESTTWELLVYETIQDPIWMLLNQCILLITPSLVFISCTRQITTCDGVTPEAKAIKIWKLQNKTPNRTALMPARNLLVCACSIHVGDLLCSSWMCTVHTTVVVTAGQCRHSHRLLNHLGAVENSTHKVRRKLDDKHKWGLKAVCWG